MNRKASIRLMIAVIGAAPLALLAAEPATQPASDSAAPPQVSQLGGGNSDDGPGRGRPGLRGGLVLSDKDHADALVFMQAHSKERYKFVENMPEGKLKQHFRDLAAQAAYRVMRLEKEDPDLYPVSVRRIELEDDVFALDAKYHRASPDQQDDIKTKLKTKVAELVDVGIKERQLRLTRLQKTVDLEKKQLADDEENKAKLVDERYTAILNAGGGLGASFKPAGPGGGNGGPGQHRGEKRQPGDAPAQ